MWQYTTETIINSNKGNLEGGVRALIVNPDGSSSGSGSGAEISDEAVLLIDGVGAYIRKYVKSVTKYEFREAKNAEVAITVPDATEAGVWRLTVALREEGRQSSIMQDAYLHHSKPFHFEVEVAANEAGADIAEKLVKVIKKTLALSDFRFFTAAVEDEDSSASGSSEGGILVLKAADCHIRFIVDAIRLDAVGTSADAAARITGFEDYTTVLTDGDIDLREAGDCGAGTVEHLVKDLRIPTNASINPFSADQGGRPVPGGQYDQYLIIYETPRHHVAHGVMGSVGEVSRTSHVLFLEQTGAKEIAELIAKFAELEDVTVPEKNVGLDSKPAEAGSVQ